jgi:hypothetical protein
MDILARLKRLKTSLNDINSNLQSNMSIKSPGEINPEDELGSEPEETDEITPEDIPLTGEEDLTLGAGTPALPPETPPIKMFEEPPEDTTETPETQEEPTEGPEDTFGTENEVTGAPEDEDDEDKPQKREWEPIVPPDNDMKSLSFKSDKEKIFLDMKRTDLNDRLWLARLYKDGKILEHGQVIIPEKCAKDPITYILGLADGMLDRRTLRYEGEWQAYYDAKKKAAEEPEIEPTEVSEAPPEDTEGEEDILGDILGDTEGAPEAEAPAEAPEAEAPAEGEEDILGDILGGAEGATKPGVEETEEAPAEAPEEDVLADLFK